MNQDQQHSLYTEDDFPLVVKQGKPDLKSNSTQQLPKKNKTSVQQRSSMRNIIDPNHRGVYNRNTDIHWDSEKNIFSQDTFI